MYKRPAHILFVSVGNLPMELPCYLLTQQESELMQGRCVGIEQLVAMNEGLEWADLVVALDESVYRRLQEAVPKRHSRCWPLPRKEQELLAFLSEKLNSMAAGMRMMQRLDD